MPQDFFSFNFPFFFATVLRKILFVTIYQERKGLSGWQAVTEVFNSFRERVMVIGDCGVGCHHALSRFLPQTMAFSATTWEAFELLIFCFQSFVRCNLGATLNRSWCSVVGLAASATNDQAPSKAQTHQVPEETCLKGFGWCKKALNTWLKL